MYINLNTGKETLELPEVVAVSSGVVHKPDLKVCSELGWRRADAPEAPPGYTILSVKWLQDEADPLRAKADLVTRLTSEIEAEQAAGQAAALEQTKVVDSDPAFWSRRDRCRMNWLVKQLNDVRKPLGLELLTDKDVTDGLREEVDADGGVGPIIGP